jgi:hypothetical protein
MQHARSIGHAAYYCLPMLGNPVWLAPTRTADACPSCLGWLLEGTIHTPSCTPSGVSSQGRLCVQNSTLDGLDPALRRRVERMYRGTLGPASTSGHTDAPVDTDDLATVINAAPALATTPALKDRRSKDNKKLDERARVIVADLEARNVKMSKSGRGKMAELVAHPVLYPMLVKVCSYGVHMSTLHLHNSSFWDCLPGRGTRLRRGT